MVNLTKLLLDFYKLVILLAYSSSLIIDNMEEVKNTETNKESYDLLTQVYDWKPSSWPLVLHMNILILSE